MVYIQTLSSGLIELKSGPETTIGSLQRKLDDGGIAPVCIQRLMKDGNELRKEATLGHYSVTDNDVISLVLDLEGGAKKRKKKTYTTPKKVKHKRKKVKLAILNLFSTEGDRVRALRRPCPFEDKKNNQATFMGIHNDRYYCGNCHNTIAKTIDQEVSAA